MWLTAWAFRGQCVYPFIVEIKNNLTKLLNTNCSVCSAECDYDFVPLIIPIYDKTSVVPLVVSHKWMSGVAMNERVRCSVRSTVSRVVAEEEEHSTNNTVPEILTQAKRKWENRKL